MSFTRKFPKFYTVKVWVEDNQVKCASEICTEDSCPRYNDYQSGLLSVHED